ncbi:YoaK family protein [Bdellovibrio sp. HCB337]|uniref:YoaK family protein n=1 Tax=Bdellovibrio sp. HCB337 TaxID=3394358 RepID=UPI0039A51435
MFSSPDNLSHFSRRNAAIWSLLAFQAGVINAGGVLACHRFVSHTTGFATTFGTEVAYGRLWTGVGMLSVPLFFIMGAMISAFWVDRRLIKNEQPRYAIVLFMMTVLMGATAVAGVLGHFGTFGEPLVLARDYALLTILCLTSGLQNAMVTTAFGAIVRTTHLTGISTDLGIGFVRLIANDQQPQNRKNEIRATWMRLGIITSFICGSTLSSFIYLSLQYWGFVIPFFISGTLWIVSLGFFKNKTLTTLKNKIAS